MKIVVYKMDCTCGKIGTDHSKIKRWTVHVGENIRTKKKDRTCGRTFLLIKPKKISEHVRNCLATLVIAVIVTVIFVLFAHIFIVLSFINVLILLNSTKSNKR